MFLPTADGRYQLDQQSIGGVPKLVGRFATREAALANVRSGSNYRLTDRETGTRFTARQDRPGVITLIDAAGTVTRIKKPGTVPSLGLARKPLERGFAVNRNASGQPVPTITGADDPAFARLLDVARRGAAMNAANRDGR